MNFKGRALKRLLARCVGLMVGSVSQLSSASFGHYMPSPETVSGLAFSS